MDRALDAIYPVEQSPQTTTAANGHMLEFRGKTVFLTWVKSVHIMKNGSSQSNSPRTCLEHKHIQDIQKGHIRQLSNKLSLLFSRHQYIIAQTPNPSIAFLSAGEIVCFPAVCVGVEKDGSRWKVSFVYASTTVCLFFVSVLSQQTETDPSDKTGAVS